MNMYIESNLCESDILSLQEFQDNLCMPEPGKKLPKKGGHTNIHKGTINFKNLLKNRESIDKNWHSTTILSSFNPWRWKLFVSCPV